MNDPGFDDTIAQEAGTLDQSTKNGSGEQKGQLENDASHPHAGRWWLASTAYPLMAVCVHILGLVKWFLKMLTLTLTGNFRAYG